MQRITEDHLHRDPSFLLRAAGRLRRRLPGPWGRIAAAMADQTGGRVWRVLSMTAAQHTDSRGNGCAAARCHADGWVVRAALAWEYADRGAARGRPKKGVAVIEYEREREALGFLTLGRLEARLEGALVLLRAEMKRFMRGATPYALQQQKDAARRVWEVVLLGGPDRLDGWGEVMRERFGWAPAPQSESPRDVTAMGDAEANS